MDIAPSVVLVVDDHPTNRMKLSLAVKNLGHLTLQAVNGVEALERMRAEAIDLVLLDIMMPYLDGIETGRILRQMPELRETFILFLTARTEEYSEIAAFDIGADDYITKPFRLAELLARVRAQLRKPASPPEQPVLRSAGVEVDRQARTVTVSGEPVMLRAKEFDVLVTLMTNEGKVVTREDLMSQVWDEHWFGSTKTIDVHISSLRRRLGEAVGEASRITALRGVGYRWERDDA